MATTIAISGKGGSGKTTLAAMIVRVLWSQSKRAVLAVDADPNACLGITLGVKPEQTIARIREQARQKQPSGVGGDRVRSFEYGLQQAITEADGFDLVTMGRPEGPSCYCAVNNLLRTFLDELSSGYDFVVIDNEAGMEHLSRRTTNDVDMLIVAAEATALGVLTAGRIFELAKELPISVKEIGIIWNRTESAKPLEGVKTFGCVPYDTDVLQASMEGKTIFDIEQDNPALSAVQEILEVNLGKLKTRN